MGIRSWLRRRRSEKAVRRCLNDLFDHPETLAGTSLRRRHKSRYVVRDYKIRDGVIAWIRFGILRHPRPYSFSRQSHNVVEYWLYDPSTGSLTVEKGVNLTRLDGEDSSD